MKKIIFACAMLAATLSFERSAFAVTGSSVANVEDKLHFEPTQADWNCCAKAIVAQQSEYVTAKKAKEYHKAHKLALWHFQRAWLSNNEAHDIIVKNQKDIDISELKQAQGFLALANLHILAAIEAGHHMDEVDACAAKVTSNLTASDKLIKKALEAGGK